MFVKRHPVDSIIKVYLLLYLLINLRLIWWNLLNDERLFHLPLLPMRSEQNFQLRRRKMAHCLLKISAFDYICESTPRRVTNKSLFAALLAHLLTSDFLKVVEKLFHWPLSLMQYVTATFLAKKYIQWMAFCLLKWSVFTIFVKSHHVDSLIKVYLLLYLLSYLPLIWWNLLKGCFTDRYCQCSHSHIFSLEEENGTFCLKIISFDYICKTPPRRFTNKGLFGTLLARLLAPDLVKFVEKLLHWPYCQCSHNHFLSLKGEKMALCVSTLPALIIFIIFTLFTTLLARLLAPDLVKFVERLFHWPLLPMQSQLHFQLRRRKKGTLSLKMISFDYTCKTPPRRFTSISLFATFSGHLLAPYLVQFLKNCLFTHRYCQCCHSHIFSLEEEKMALCLLKWSTLTLRRFTRSSLVPRRFSVKGGMAGK